MGVGGGVWWAHSRHFCWSVKGGWGGIIRGTERWDILSPMADGVADTRAVGMMDSVLK